MKAGWFSIGGMLISPIFLLLYFIFTTLNPSYSHMNDGISYLGQIGEPYALIWNIFGFVLIGLLVIVLSFGLYVHSKKDIGDILASISLGLSGLIFSGLGFFPIYSIDNEMKELSTFVFFTPNISNEVHEFCSIAFFVLFLISLLIFSLKYRKDEQWRGFSAFCFCTFTLALVSGLVLISGWFTDIPYGVRQRIPLAIYFLWLEVISLKWYLITRRKKLTNTITTSV
jgi:hypothetical membrane protein